MTTATPPLASETPAPRFYVWMAGLCALIGFGGFSSTYWLQLADGSFVPARPILHLHAAIFSAWLILLLSQAMLAARGRITNHKAWGVAGVSLATAMVLVGPTLAVDTMERALAQGYADAARPFMLLPVGAIALFGLFFAAAVLNVSRPEWHKRLMLVATACALTAATSRFGFALFVADGPGARPGLGPPPPPELAGGDAVMMSLVLMIGVVRDWRVQGRPHPAWLLGIAALLTYGFLGPVLARSPGWAQAMDALAAIAG